MFLVLLACTACLPGIMSSNFEKRFDLVSPLAITNLIGEYSVRRKSISSSELELNARREKNGLARELNPTRYQVHANAPPALCA